VHLRRLAGLQCLADCVYQLLSSSCQLALSTATAAAAGWLMVGFGVPGTVQASLQFQAPQHRQQGGLQPVDGAGSPPRLLHMGLCAGAHIGGGQGHHTPFELSLPAPLQGYSCSS
jgi:hypothetical protein